MCGGACRGQKRALVPLEELELQMAVSHPVMVAVGTEPGSSGKAAVGLQ